ncbi:shufflon protein D' [Escherichia coli]
MYTNAQITSIFPDIVCTGSEVHFCRCPDTGLALASCQSGLWQRVSGSTVLTGKIANGERLPLPSGFYASQCTWSVSNAENPHGWKPNYFAGSVATYDSNRIVKCGYYDEYNFHGGTNRNDLTGKCSYIVVCQ